MMGHARLGSAAIQLSAGRFRDAAKTADDVQAHRVAQGVKQSLEGEVAGGGMFEWAHDANHTQGFTNQP